jgi:hypothetical protein
MCIGGLVHLENEGAVVDCSHSSCDGSAYADKGGA